jgi:hypothetical protein
VIAKTIYGKMPHTQRSMVIVARKCHAHEWSLQYPRCSTEWRQTEEEEIFVLLLDVTMLTTRTRNCHFLDSRRMKRGNIMIGSLNFVCKCYACPFIWPVGLEA